MFESCWRAITLQPVWRGRKATVTKNSFGVRVGMRLKFKDGQISD